jgi:hypothetical protein
MMRFKANSIPASSTCQCHGGQLGFQSRQKCIVQVTRIEIVGIEHHALRTPCNFSVGQASLDRLISSLPSNRSTVCRVTFTDWRNPALKPCRQWRCWRQCRSTDRRLTAVRRSRAIDTRHTVAQGKAPIAREQRGDLRRIGLPPRAVRIPATASAPDSSEFLSVARQATRPQTAHRQRQCSRLLVSGAGQAGGV